MINWPDKYLLNIEHIDQQHKGFFELWNKEFRQATSQDSRQTAFVIEQLENYIKEHFSFEEKLLRKSGYEELDNHIAQHHFFIQKVNEMKLDHNYMNPLLYEKIAVFMKKWFLSHILRYDKDYKEIVIKYLASDIS